MEGLQTISLDVVVENPHNPRKTYDEARLSELAASIKEQGLLQPVVVRPKDGAYEIVCGHRRCRAARLAGLGEVPALIRKLNNKQAAAAAVVENLQREDVAPLEEADAFALMRKQGFKASEIAVKIGRPTRYVTDRLKLRKLIERHKTALANGRLPLGGAMLLVVHTPHHQEQIAKEVYFGELAVTVGDVRHALTRHSRPMANAPWDLDDASLPGRKESCARCPMRSGAQVGLWGERNSDRCLVADCWAQRIEAWVKRQVETASAPTQVVYHKRHPWGQRLLEEPCSFLEEEPTWGSLAGDAPHTIWTDKKTYAYTTINPKEVIGGLERAGRQAEADALREAMFPARDTTHAKERAHREAEQEKALLEHRKEVSTVIKALTPDKNGSRRALPGLLALRLAVRANPGGATRVCARRSIPTRGMWVEEALLRYADRQPAEQPGLLVEVLIEAAIATPALVEDETPWEAVKAYVAQFNIEEG